MGLAVEGFRALPEQQGSQVDDYTIGALGYPTMPSLEHNALVEMFRENPGLVPRVLAHRGLAVPAYDSVVVTEAALDQLVPIVSASTR